MYLQLDLMRPIGCAHHVRQHAAENKRRCTKNTKRDEKEGKEEGGKGREGTKRGRAENHSIKTQMVRKTRAKT